MSKIICFIFTVNIPYKHDEFIKLGEKNKDAASEHGMNKVYGEKVRDMANNLKKNYGKIYVSMMKIIWIYWPK